MISCHVRDMTRCPTLAFQDGGLQRSNRASVVKMALRTSAASSAGLRGVRIPTDGDHHSPFKIQARDIRRWQW